MFLMQYIMLQNLGRAPVRIEITDEDIAYAENLLLPDGAVFNGERRAFIRCMDSRDVVACPGSGKTTALLAKLLILAKKMPFEDGRGVCVLTHTNVAIEEIKRRARIASASLFRYPNFFGTIHSFIGKYLAMPAYIDLFNNRDIKIDDYLYQMRAHNEFTNQGLDGNKVIYFQVKDRLKGKSRAEQRRIKQEFFNQLEFRFDNSYVSYCRGANHKVVVKGSINPSESYWPIHNAKFNLLESGYLRYQDVFSLGSRYILNNKEIGSLFQNRFLFLFVDEMQDSDADQITILDSVFHPDSEIIIQRIGDPNQAIYHNVDDTSNDLWSLRNPLHFSDSRRYGKTITHLLETVRLYDNVTLQPCDLKESQPTYLITYQDGEEQMVIQAFSHLIDELSNELPNCGKYKAIGWIGKDRTTEGKLCIPAYFPNFDSSLRAPSNYFPNMISYVAYAVQIANTEGAKGFHEIILQGIIRALDLAGIRDEASKRCFTPSILDKFWKHEHERSYREFREKMAKYFLLALNSDVKPTILRNEIKFALQSDWPEIDKAFTFLNDDSITPALEMGKGATQIKNQFIGANETVIHIGTVHSAKGETHTATLYLETYYQRETDVGRLIEFLKGNRPKGQLEKARHKQNLKIAHVAFSRPTHLLAFACRSSSISGHEDGLKQNGWVIRTVTELNSKER